MFNSSLQAYRVGTHLILVHPLQLAVDLLPQLLGVGVGEEAGHDGGGDDELRAPVNPLHTVSSRTRSSSCSPGFIEDWSAPDSAGLVQSQGPVEFVSLQPPGVHVSVELVGLITSSQVVVELRDEARHEVASIVSQEIVAVIDFMSWSSRYPITSRLSLSTHVGLEILVGLGACWGGEVSYVGHQVILVERPKEMLDYYTSNQSTLQSETSRK